MSVGTDTVTMTRRQRRLSRPLLWLVCGGVTTGSLIALASRWHWFAELFSHFRLHYLLAQGVLFVVFLNTRRYAWLVATLLLSLPNAWYVLPYLAPLLPDSETRAELSAAPELVTVNLNYRNTDQARMLAYLQASDADVLVLSEFTPDWELALDQALADWPHRVLRPREDPFGLAVYAREPVEQVQRLRLGAPGSENLRLLVQAGGQTVELYAVHLFPPTTAWRAAARNQQLDSLAQLLSRPAEHARLVTGDLNLTPFSPYFGDFLKASGFRDARLPEGLHVTWPTFALPLWIAIDHCLAAPELEVYSVRTGPNIGSDHFPLEIRLAAGN